MGGIHRLKKGCLVVAYCCVLCQSCCLLHAYIGSLLYPRICVSASSSFSFYSTYTRGGGVEKIRAHFFRTPLPLWGYRPKKQRGPHVGLFFARRNFFYLLLLELAWHLHFATSYDIGTWTTPDIKVSGFSFCMAPLISLQ